MTTSSLSEMYCCKCHAPLSTALSDSVRARIAELDSTIQHLRQELEESRRMAFSAYRSTSALQSPCNVPGRFDGDRMSPFSVSFQHDAPHTSDGTNKPEGGEDDGSENNTPVDMALSQRRKSSVFAAFPVESSSLHRSFHALSPTTSSGSMTASQKGAKKLRDAVTVSFVVRDDGVKVVTPRTMSPNSTSPTAAVDSSPLHTKLADSVFTLPASQSSTLPAPQVATHQEGHQEYYDEIQTLVTAPTAAIFNEAPPPPPPAAESAANCDMELQYVGEREVEDVGVQTRLTIRADASSQTEWSMPAVASPVVSRRPFPPKVAVGVRGEDYHNRCPPLAARAVDRPLSATYESTYEQRRGGRISSVAAGPS
jgi:hypothetical protein